MKHKKKASVFRDVIRLFGEKRIGYKKVKNNRESIIEEYNLLRKEIGSDLVEETIFTSRAGELIMRQRYIKGIEVSDYVENHGLGCLRYIFEKIEFVYQKKTSNGGCFW